MPCLLLSPAASPRLVSGLDDPIASAASGPATLVAAEDPRIVLAARPLAYRESGGQWHTVGGEAADHWTNLSPELRTRLLADHSASVSVDEFKATTNGASAALITSNWVHSGHPRRYRLAGQLRSLAEVLAAVAAAHPG